LKTAGRDSGLLRHIRIHSCFGIEKMSNKASFDELIFLIDETHKLALHLNQEMAAYLLSMASLEVAEAVERMNCKKHQMAAAPPLQ
jgi:hypothetical protein